MADVAFDVLLETGIRIQPLPVWEDEWEHPESYSNPRNGSAPPPAKPGKAGAYCAELDAYETSL